jgi:hypothetical protein
MFPGLIFFQQSVRVRHCRRAEIACEHPGDFPPPASIPQNLDSRRGPSGFVLLRYFDMIIGANGDTR